MKKSVSVGMILAGLVLAASVVLIGCQRGKYGEESINARERRIMERYGYDDVNCIVKPTRNHPRLSCDADSKTIECDFEGYSCVQVVRIPWKL